MARRLDLAFRALASILVASLIVAAWHDVSKAWDVWSYHLPFAARIAGIVEPPSYTFGHANELRFAGFPLFAEAMQGLLWRVTGRPECANFVALAAIPGLAIFLRRAFAVPLHLTALALLAVPLVQIHATSAYIDLPANACAAMLVLCAYRAVVAREAPSVRALVVAGVFAAATANAKFQLVPIVVAASLVIAVVCALRKDAARTRRLVVLYALLPLVFATPLKNFVLHGNPVWPIALHLPGLDFPHAEGAYASSPRWLEHAPGPVRFACSALEIGLRPIASHRRWSLDQWTPPAEDGYRMGGFFGAYVIANVIALVVAVVTQKTREARVMGAFVVGTTLVVSCLPQSHELRYYMVWMMVLLASNLVLWSRARPITIACVATCALAIVAWSTEGTYLYASGDSFTTLVANKTRGLDEAIAPGERVCVAKQPWTFLWAPRFHPGRSYSVQEAEDEGECDSARVVP